jgi:hypothetical protein
LQRPAAAITSDPAAASEVTDAGSDPADAAAAGAEATDAYAAAVVDTPTLPSDGTPSVLGDFSTQPAATPDAAADAANAVAAAAANAVAAAAAKAVAEPAGWAAAPDNDVADLAAQVGADDIAADQAVDAAVEVAAESSVPAGWYADPSGRYELRYWDGSAWTEHVSRAGQQFTDPPVA